MTYDADILLVTVNVQETQELLRAFREATGYLAAQIPINDRLYRDLGSVNGTRVFHTLSEMGSASPGAALQTVEKGIRALNPGAVVGVGIAFGVNQQKQKIGDILISQQLLLYELQRAGKQIHLRGDKPHASTRLINFFAGIAQTSWDGARASTGLLLSGEKLIDNIDYRDQLLSLEREAIGGEMEGAGLYVACQDYKVDWIVIKAICDWADGEKFKNKTARQRRAARNAAEFLIHSLKQAPLPKPVELPSIAPPSPPTSHFDESQYVAALGEQMMRLQRQRSFIDPWSLSVKNSLTASSHADETSSGATVAQLHATRLNPSGQVDSGLPSLGFRIQARKMSTDELRQKYGGAELNYDDYLALIATSGTSEVNDVIDYLLKMRKGWAIQVLGAPGIGKSFILRATSIAWANSYNDVQPIVPFYVELRDAPANGFHNSSEVLTFVATSVSRCTGLPEQDARVATERILAEGRAVVFFDAIDEANDPVASLRPITEFMSEDKHRANRYVFSCRTFDEVPGLGAEELVLLPLSHLSLKQYFRAALNEHPLLAKVEKKLRDPQLRRVLGTPLAASAYARFVRDRNETPLNLYATLSDTIQMRFLAAGVQRGVLPQFITEEELTDLYQPTQSALQLLAHEMQNSFSISRSRAQDIIADVWQDSSDVAADPLVWGQLAGILYLTVDDRIAFCLHRYKELYLAEMWTEEYVESGEWPEEVEDRIGRVLWTDALTLLNDLVEEPEEFLYLLLDFCESRREALSDTSIVTKYRLIETIILLGRLAGNRSRTASVREIYYRVLFMTHSVVFNPTLTPSDRARLVRALGSHGAVSAADLLLAMYDDAAFVDDALAKSTVREAALGAMAELIANDVLDQRRIDEFVRRAGRHPLEREIVTLLQDSPQANQLVHQIERNLRRRHLKQTVIGVSVLIFLGVAFFVVRSLGIAGIAVLSAITLVACVLPLLVAWLKQWRSVRTTSHEDVDQDQGEEMAGVPEQDTETESPLLPYTPERYWVPKEHVSLYWTRYGAPPWLRAMWSGMVVSVLALVMTLGIAIVKGIIKLIMSIRFLAEVLRVILAHSVLVVIIAVTAGIAAFVVRERWTRRKRQLERQRIEREWEERLQRVREESERLRANDVDVEYIMDHLMEGVPFGAAGLGVVQARLEAIRRHMLSDPEAVEQLRRHADKIGNLAVRKLLWSVIEDISRIHVMQEEKRLYREEPSRTHFSRQWPEA